ncbi:helix-turn-helix transcriptional regulator [Fodinicola acaciae]|uniref:helix-turn-helix transcriptional regulator n=1 Tax=Fodinicola acaciae TaxID=2681555 RepID=UPI0013D2BF21|nr:YafY family protein [Fodinicola acaciae]
MAISVSEHLPRLLAMVPYLLARPGIRVEEAAADLGVTETQLRQDLNLLFVCGLPGYGPGDLIDMVLDDDTVTITYHAGIDRPLRLTADEALALIVGLRALGETPGLSQDDAIDRALSKLESAAGDAASAASRVAVKLRTSPTEASRANALRAALEHRHAVRMTYYTATRDETTDRVVDPIRLLVVDGRSYLEAWCRSADAVRRFRLDRIDELTELDEPAAPPPGAGGDDVTGGVFKPGPGDLLITLRLSRSARWVAEYYPVESVTHKHGGDTEITMWASDLGWARRMVLGLGTDVRVVAPVELAEAVRHDAQQALLAYQE